ncbi:sterol desaturase family protein [Bacillus suaedaesalsae]|uniref:Sterol desaturase family protein n=1 Tax=Bacillus suaedaesalsae TaxID=2810349 RepID=A0ABS2DF02_9BACI|nr:sterol desaturase family protein [Bacillus suaedaesalsae]MBM6617028.1 sterol desaturase family protein [Bacillus suaedaesalsae]
MGKYIREFFSIHDIWILGSLIFLALLSVTPQLGRWEIWLSFVVGIILYIISEYMTHRFFFHMKAPKNKSFLKFMKRIHYDHHEEPNDLKLLFLPIWYSLPQLVIVVLAVTLLTGDVFIALAVFAGTASTILYYEWTHYVAHRPYQPKTRWGKYMKKLHILHHFKNEKYWYGVTNPSMDYLFGTMKDGKDVSKSETAKKLTM